MAYIDDLAVLTKNTNNLQYQINKLQKFAERAHMDLNLVKCAIARSMNKAKLKPIIFEDFIQAQNITYKEKQSSILTQTEPHIHLNLHFVPQFKWQIQIDSTMC